jgi:predicted transcriptional regulator
MSGGHYLQLCNVELSLHRKKLMYSPLNLCSSSDHAHDVELRMSKEQMSNSALNIMNNALITGGTFTFNIVQKTENH